MWLFIARWQYFSADGASTRLHQRRRRESSFFLVGWRDLVADLRTCIELVGFVFFFYINSRHAKTVTDLPEVVKNNSFPWTLRDFYVHILQRF